MIETTIWEWLRELRAALRRSAWWPALEVEGIDGLDALLVPLYQGALVQVRDGGADALGSPRPSLARGMAAAARLLRGQPPETWRRLRAAVNSSPPRPASVAFWPRQINHVMVQEPVAVALATRGVENLFLTAHPGPFEAARRQGQTITWAPRAWSRRLQEAAGRAARGDAVLRRDPGVPLPTLPEIGSGNVDWLRQTLRSHLPAVHAAADTTEALFETIRPRILVVGNDLTLEGRTAALVAQRHGVITACLMHGLVRREPLHSAHIADRFLLYGERSCRQLLDLGAVPETLVVCGCPKMDPPPRQQHRLDPRLRRLGVTPGQPWVLVATSGPGHSVSLGHHERIVSAIARLSRKRREVRFVVKLHPKDPIACYRPHSGETPWVVAEHGRRDLPREIFDWLQGCHAVITGASTVAVEAMLLEVPVITVDLEEELTAVDFIREGATLHANDEAELEGALDAALECPAAALDTLERARRFAAETFHQPPGGATAKVATTLLELLMGEGG